MVYGQSRVEHEHWVTLSNKACEANQVLDNDTNGTSIHFLAKGEVMHAPKLNYPHFPTVNSQDGNDMKSFYEMSQLDPTIVHELCALHMFQARVNRSK
jgi:hypothetical protein